MTDADKPARPAQKKNLFAQLELDTRLLGMIGAFIFYCVCVLCGLLVLSGHLG